MAGVVAILEGLGVDANVVATSQQALSRQDRDPYDVIVSDMRRGLTTDEGLRFLKELRKNGENTPVIFTVGDYRPELGTPPYAFGITNRIDELLNLLFDALERVRG
jgi:CheY-like chemotaxis protein